MENSSDTSWPVGVDVRYQIYVIIRLYLISLFVFWKFVSFRSPSLFYLLVHSRCPGCLFSLDHTQTHTPQSVGLLWTRDRPVAETST
jgi:hypothetical protein